MKACALLVVSLLTACGTTRAFVPDREHGFIARGGGDHRYFVYVPRDWTPDKKWPVILYLHGGAEAGPDGVRPTQVGLGPEVYKSRGTLPFVIAFPQAKRAKPWPVPEMQARALAVLDEVLREFSGDPERVYLTGNSMGGYGTWIIGSRHPEKFAALAPICGGISAERSIDFPGDPPARDDAAAQQRIQSVARLPIWAFHGSADAMVPVTETQAIVAKLQKLGANVRYTEYPGVGHASWEKAYADPELFAWFLSHKR